MNDSVLAKAMAEQVKAFMKLKLAGIESRISSLESARAVVPEPGKDGLDGKDGKDGERGADGLGFDDLTMTYDGERTFTFTMQRGEETKSFDFKAPIVLYRGVYSADQEYEKGDSATFGGSVWICQVDNTKSKPGDASGDWKLAVKRGRDGKDGYKPKEP